MKRALGVAFGLIFACHVADAAETSGDWRKVDPANLLLIETKYGTTAVELAPAFAPNHVARMHALAAAHFYDGTTFYRVIEGFVAQGGVGEDTASTKDKPKDPDVEKKWPALKAEFERPWRPEFTALGSPDLFAKQAGHVDGFP